MAHGGGDRPQDRGGFRTAHGFALLAACLAALSLPLLTHPLPPLADHINHLAGAYVIDTIGGDPDLARFYRIDWALVPNLVVDLIVPALHPFVGIYAAGQIFLLLTFFLIVGGMLFLHRALFRAWSVFPLIAAPLLYNTVLLVGVTNYLFSIGVALIALGAWIVLRERAWPLRLSVSALFAFLLFLCHLFGVGLYGLGLLAFELLRLRERRDAPLIARLADFAATGAPFIPVLVLLLRSPTWDAAGAIGWSLDGKLDGLVMVFDVYDHAVTAGLIVIAGLLAAWAIHRGALRVHPFAAALLAAGGLVYLLMPRVLFAAHLADQRLPIALAFMLVAGLDLDVRTVAVRRAFVGALTLMLAMRIGEVQFVWDRLAAAPRQVLQAVKRIERGSRVLVVHGDREHYSDIYDPSLDHAASLATIERSALVSTAFTVKGKHVLRVREAFRPFVETQDRTPPSVPWFVQAAHTAVPYFFSRWPLHFDYVVILFTKPGTKNPGPEDMSLVFEGKSFQLYRVKKDDVRAVAR